MVKELIAFCSQSAGITGGIIQKRFNKTRWHVPRNPPKWEAVCPQVKMAEHDVHFVEIAGNSQILISVLANQKWRYSRPDAQQMFSTPVLTRGDLQRFVLNCDVASLHSVLNNLRGQGVAVEHVYDY
jgi:hypothetical protein